MMTLTKRQLRAAFVQLEETVKYLRVAVAVETVAIGVLLLTLLFLGPCAAYAEVDVPTGHFLMVDENGRVFPENYAVGISDIAEAEATTAAAAAKAEAVQEAADEVTAIVDDIALMIEGETVMYGYIDGFVLSLGGAVSVDPDAVCYITEFTMGEKITSGEYAGYTPAYIQYGYNTPMNNTPVIYWRSTLDDGGEWQSVTVQESEQIVGSVEMDGVTLDNMYQGTIYIPSESEKPFYKVFCSVNAVSGDGSTFPIVGGITINGKTGYTGVVTNGIYEFTYEGGLLMQPPVSVDGVFPVGTP